MMRIQILGAALLSIAVATGFVGRAASAEIYKCKDQANQVVYTDAPCPGGVVLKPLESASIPTPAKPSPATSSQAAPSTFAGSGTGSPGPYVVTSDDRQRIANLEQVLRTADNAQKREAARMEIFEIQRGTVARMSYEDVRRKDGYWVDLGNLDERRRRTAFTQLADLFARYRSSIP